MDSPKRSWKGRKLSRKQLRWTCVAAAVAVPPLLIIGCSSLSFYNQAIWGQLEIYQKQVPSGELIADPGASVDLKEKLGLIEELRKFAAKALKLPSGDNYTRYVDLGRDHVVWSVFAAPEFSLEPKTWWYPVVGRLSYRGFFNQRDAEKLADRLRREGYDVHVGGVDAYSTLGWFRDPVLNTFIFDGDLQIAELIFHELTHRRLYVSGKTDFNEALATAVAQEGVRRWLRSKGTPSALAEYEEAVERRREVYRRIADARMQLERLYLEADEPEGAAEPEELRRRKAAIFAGLKSEYAALRAGWSPARGADTEDKRTRSNWFSQDLSNAHLNAVATYHQLVPMFDDLLEKHGADMDEFFEVAKEAGKTWKAAE